MYPYFHSRQLTAPLGTVSYTVQPGDTLSKIARFYNTTVENILKFNYIPNPNVIYPGRTLVIPESPAEAIIYTVQPGDTVYSIARKFGTYVNNIVTFNYLANPNLIYPGQKLVVTASLM
ncbi:MAG: LysM peptidoglycan-binding domain-containing protein [Bacillota bacterium]